MSSVSGSNGPSPPPYVRVIYDETHRGKWYGQASIVSLANHPNFLGQLEHHSPDTDGSFSICVAQGQGIFVAQVPPLCPD
jgi:hypothetical protein